MRRETAPSAAVDRKRMRRRRLQCAPQRSPQRSKLRSRSKWPVAAGRFSRRPHLKPQSQITGTVKKEHLKACPIKRALKQETRERQYGVIVMHLHVWCVVWRCVAYGWPWLSGVTCHVYVCATPPVSLEKRSKIKTTTTTTTTNKPFN